MSKILAVAANTFREAIRDKILYNLVFFALLVMGFSVAIGKMTLGERIKIIQDVSLAAMSVFGLLIAIFVGIGLVHKEIQRRTVYVLLAKPIARWRFVVGKYLGLMAVIALNVALMTASLLVLMALFAEGGVHWGVLTAVLLIMVELMVVTAVAVLFSTFSTPTLSAMLTLGVWLIGRFSSDLMVLAQKSDDPVTRWLMAVVHYALPNLEKFDVKHLVVYQMPIEPAYVVAAVAYGAVYIVFLIALAAAIFQRRDFK
jgi:ABC-type transport system involved in multi-copper enzyme maturation permease subunit